MTFDIRFLLKDNESMDLYQFVKKQRIRERELDSLSVLLSILQFLQPIMKKARIDGKGESSLLGKIDHACILLRESTDERVSLKIIAQEVGLSYSSFRREFRKKMGVSPNTYCISDRMHRSKELLLKYSVKEVADQLGYADPFTFSEQFKKEIGLSPRAWKQKEKQS